MQRKLSWVRPSRIVREESVRAGETHCEEGNEASLGFRIEKQWFHRQKEIEAGLSHRLASVTTGSIHLSMLASDQACAPPNEACISFKNKIPPVSSEFDLMM